jgi:hypothetical protein
MSTVQRSASEDTASIQIQEKDPHSGNHREWTSTSKTSKRGRGALTNLRAKEGQVRRLEKVS